MDHSLAVWLSPSCLLAPPKKIGLSAPFHKFGAVRRLVPTRELLPRLSSKVTRQITGMPLRRPRTRSRGEAISIAKKGAPPLRKGVLSRSVSADGKTDVGDYDLSSVAKAEQKSKLSAMFFGARGSERARPITSEGSCLAEKRRSELASIQPPEAKTPRVLRGFSLTQQTW